MTLREARIASHELTEYICSAGRVIFLAECQSQLNPRVGVVRIETDGFFQCADAFVQLARLCQSQTKVIVRLRQVGIAHGCLPEFLERVRVLVLTPVQQAEARVGLCVVWLQLQCFLERRQSLLGVTLALPCEAQVVVAGRQLGTLLDGLLKETKSIAEFLVLQCAYALKGKQFRLRQARTKPPQTIDVVQFLLSSFRLALGMKGDPKVVMRLFVVRFQLDGALQGCDGAYQVAASFQFLSKIELCSGITRIGSHRFAEFR